MGAWDGAEHGPRVIHMLAQKWTVMIVRDLYRGSARPVELEQRLTGIPHSVLMDRLKQLVACGAAVSHRTGKPPPADGVQAHYSLTQSGEELLTIIAEAVQWESRRAANRVAE